MIETFENVFKIPELRKRILFTLALLVVYRLGGHVPTPELMRKPWASFSERCEGHSLVYMICL